LKQANESKINGSFVISTRMIGERLENAVLYSSFVVKAGSITFKQF
jgi:hypothetical protein